MAQLSLNTQVRQYWEAGACGTTLDVVGDKPAKSQEWFAQVENHRYAVEPFIHSIAQFTRHRGKKILEVGVGAGTDHLQWAKAGAQCYGVDLTDEAIQTTKDHLAHHGLESQLQRIDAEQLPFDDASFDIVYSWGVIHHSEHPEEIIAEIQRVLKPGGSFIGMLYNRYSIAVYRAWIMHALLRGRPWRTLSDVLYNHIESIGTKAYTVRELQKLFCNFTNVSTQKLITHSDTHRLPSWLGNCLPKTCGWFIAINASKSHSGQS